MNDLISRQDAIDAVKKNTFRLTFAEEQNCEGHVAWSAEAVYSDVMEGALLELPSAQPYTDEEIQKMQDIEQAQLDKAYEMGKADALRWIPCSTRLPEKPNVYTVTDSKGDVVRFVFTGTDSSREYWKRCAKAWMPPPEPYKEDDK